MGNIEVFPAMVARIANIPLGTQCVGVHRTYLSDCGQKAPGVARKVLGSIKGACIPLGAPVGGRIGVTEGIETGLAVMQATGLRCWAAVSAPGMRALLLPPTINEVVIFSEPDPAGASAAEAAAERWSAEGVKVRIAISPDGDANDVLMMNGKQAVRHMLSRAQVY